MPRLPARETPLLPLPGAPGRGLGRGASEVPRQSAFDSLIDAECRIERCADATRTPLLSPALSPEYRDEGVRRCARSLCAPRVGGRGFFLPVALEHVADARCG